MSEIAEAEHDDLAAEWDPLVAHIEYDATPEGQRKLSAALDAANPEDIPQLKTRATLGAVAHRAWRENHHFIPRREDRSSESDDLESELNERRYNLGFELALIAASASRRGEPNATFASWMLQSMEQIRHLDRVWRDPLEAARFDPTSYATHGLVAEWIDADLRKADVGDIPVLIALGLDVRWDRDAEIVLAWGELDPAHRWGYVTGEPRDDGSVEVVLAPRICSCTPKRAEA